MIRNLGRTALILGLGLAGPPVRADEPAPKNPAPPVKLGKLPDLRLGPRPAADQAKKIRDLIVGLATLDKPDFGLSSTMSGNAFSPVPGQSQTGAFLLTRPRPSAVRRSESPGRPRPGRPPGSARCARRPDPHQDHGQACRRVRGHVARGRTSP